MRALNQPVAWWGWHWEPPVPMSVCELIRAGNMSARLAAMFWIGMERGASIIIAADPPNSGKTTTLSALLAFTPPETMVYFTRGVGEPFLVPVVSDSYPTYVLINELSNHIPVYTWDDDARRAFELLGEGYRLGSTMHDETVGGVLRQLGGDLAIPTGHLARLTFIVPLYIGKLHPVMRRVLEVAFIQPDGDSGLRSRIIASWDLSGDSFEVLSRDEDCLAFASWAGLSVEDLTRELDAREGVLRGLLERGETSIAEVNNAIEAFYEQRPAGGRSA